jgi:hypothetical protein
VSWSAHCIAAQMMVACAAYSCLAPCVRLASLGAVGTTSNVAEPDINACSCMPHMFVNGMLRLRLVPQMLVTRACQCLCSAVHGWAM